MATHGDPHHPLPIALTTKTIPNKKPVRCDVIFTGRVQGVGFRAATVDILTPCPIKGYVENLRDSTVHLVAEGEREVVSSAIHAILGTMATCIIDHSETWSGATGEFQDFRIRRKTP